MATSIGAAKEKFRRKMSTTGGANYDAAKGHMAADYAEGLRAVGVQVGPNTQQAYAAGIQSVSGSEVASRAAASADKWERNYMRAMAR